MPPKPRFTREEIVAAALDIVSRKGIEALTARELGDTAERCIEAVYRDYDLSPAQARVLFEHV